MQAKIVCKSADTFDMYLPIQKVDRERRIVSGFATADNVDREKDLVTADASERAFNEWIGNVREMHSPIAVGKAIGFETRKFVAPDGAEYNGVYVDAYVSKGAQDTWEKVLDGTLTGFSVGGAITQHHMEKSADGETVRKVTGYKLRELSLVDSPGNQYANLMSIQKGEVVGASVVDTLDVYYNDDTEEFLLTKSASHVEEDSGYAYKGWIEDGGDRLENLKKLLGGNSDMDTATEVSEVSDEVVESPSAEELIKSLGDKVDELTKRVDSIDAEVEEDDADEESFESLEKKIGEVAELLKTFGEQLNEQSERLEKVEQTGAERKSVEVDDAEEDGPESRTISKVFGGSFLPKSEVFA